MLRDCQPVAVCNSVASWMMLAFSWFCFVFVILWMTVTLLLALWCVMYNCSEAAEQVTRLPLPEDSSLEALGHVSHAFLRSAAKVWWLNIEWRVCRSVTWILELLIWCMTESNHCLKWAVCTDDVHVECTDWLMIGLVNSV